MINSNPFKSFWMGGFECSDLLNVHGDRVDMLSLTGHLDRINEDYEQLKSFGIATVREGIRWSQVERRPYEYEWDEVEIIVRAAEKHNLQIIYDLCHFGFPDDLSPLHPHFTKRFVRLCEEFIRFYKRIRPDDTPFITPINEAGFISWLGGEVACTVPYANNIGWHVKYHLMKAYIAGMAAIKAIDPSARFLSVEPIINVIPDHPDPQLCQEVHAIVQDQFQCLDMLSGRICPELGGRPEYLDILGFDYYYDSQWHHPSRCTADWKNPETVTGYRPLSSLLINAYQKYKRPIILSETSHPLEDRPDWIWMITDQCSKVVASGIPFWGICIYPLIDRPDWNQPNLWHRSGIWDMEITNDSLDRIMCKPYAEAILACQKKFPKDHINASFTSVPGISHEPEETYEEVTEQDEAPAQL